jgi:type IV secretory pathway VirB2 component (pilin)
MKLFRVYLAIILIALTGYTLMVGINHGWNLLPIFFANIFEMSWSGQFNFDFMTF